MRSVFMAGRSLRGLIGWGLLAAWGGLAIIPPAVEWLRPGFHWPACASDQDNISNYLTRFDVLRSRIPPGTVLGYWGDKRQDLQTVMAFILAQYALPPSALVKDVRREFVLGNFLDKAPDEAARRDRGLVLVRDFGNGVMLFRTRTKS
jgi:hypothetical protein